MILPIILYSEPEEQSLRDICAEYAPKAKIIEKGKGKGITGCVYTCYEIYFSKECTLQDRSALIRALIQYELAHPGVWNVPEE